MGTIENETRKSQIEMLMDECEDCVRDGSYTQEWINTLKAAIEALKHKPRKGHWVSDGHGHIVCTACNNANVTIWKSSFCPNCGADMREMSE